MGSVGGVEIDNVFDSAFWDEPEVVDGKVAMGVDDTIALIVKNIGKREQFQEAGFSSAGLADYVDMTTAVASEETELVIDATEVSQAEGGNVFVVGGIAGYEREFCGRFGGF